MTEEHHNTPCDYTKSNLTAIKWVLGICIVLVGAGIGFSLKESESAMIEAKGAVKIAIAAKDKSAAVDVLSARIESVQEDVRELKDMRRTLESMARDLAVVAASQETITVKVDSLTRGD